MLKPKSLPSGVVADSLNQTTMRMARGKREAFAVHVSSVIETSGPWAFCARYEVLSYHSDKDRATGKLTPARRLLFATGHFQHAYVIEQFRKNSPFGKYIYANWSCEEFDDENLDNPNNVKHAPMLGTFENVIKIKCGCGLPRTKHNEIDLHYRKYMVVGHPDMVICLRQDNGKDRYWLYEFKTIDRADITFDDIEIVLPGHRLQVSFYYHIMKSKGLDVSRKLRVLYIDRSNRKLFGGYPYKELVCQPEHPELLKPIVDRLLLTKQGIKTGRLPDRICREITVERAKACDRAVECFSRRNAYVEPREIHSGGRPVLAGHRRLRPRQLRVDA
jgi:hypothetical protein